MTDQRARAKALVDTWWETDKGLDGLEDDVTQALADERRRADEEAKRLRECLIEVNRTLQDPDTEGVNDTIWHSGGMTLVEFIDGVLGENPDQLELPIAKAHAGQEG